MTSDSSIRAQGYQYFLQEAPELLQVLESGLLSLSEDSSINKVNTLMRATHTLKGAAASLELEAIAKVAHSFEDVFRGLCRPEVSIDAEITALLFEGFECLRSALWAELTATAIDESDVLDRAATVFTQLQEHLGDYFDQDAAPPTSVELGFDVTRSIFETGVTHRLTEIADQLAAGPSAALLTLLQTQAEVFAGLSESLGLPGFGAIAEAVLAAIEQCPDHIEAIAQVALEDFQQGQAAVLSGDRHQGGQPSEALLAFTQSGVLPAVDSESAVEGQTEDQGQLLEIWGDALPEDTALAAIEPALPATTADPTAVEPDPLRLDEVARPRFDASAAQARTPTPPAPTVRIQIDHLDQLDYGIGELLTQHNQQSLQAEQVQAAMRRLYAQLQHHQQRLSQLQGWMDRLPAPSPAKVGAKGISPPRPFQAQVFTQGPQATLPPIRFDVLELDQYSEPQLAVQALLDDIVQLTEAADAVALFAQQSRHTQEKQGRLLSQIRGTLVEGRMFPLGQLFERFYGVLQPLETRHHKPVTLTLTGTEVLVDKAIAERLYDPLLHLVRNAFDHGIEPAAVRQQRHKPQAGQLKITARHQGKRLVIEVQDDGGGIDLEHVRQRALALQIISPEEADGLDPDQLADLLFEPGFSTADHVSRLSGRGVGLDVVRSQLRALEGDVTVTSTLQAGTTFTLQIPLRLTVAKLLLCQAGSKTYALLPDNIAQIMIPKPNQIQQREHCRALHWGDGAAARLVPIYRLAEAIAYPRLTHHLPAPAAPANGCPQPHVLLVEQPEGLIGIEVDQMLGEQELVIRPLDALLNTPPYIFGASILADGRLTLVLDSAVLAKATASPEASFQNAKAQSSQPGPPNHTQPTPRSGPPSVAATVREGSEGSRALPSEESSTMGPLLVVDDSITTRQTLALTLQRAGYRVIQAQDGQEAVDQLSRHADVPLVICDIEMPRMNGFELLQHCF